MTKTCNTNFRLKQLKADTKATLTYNLNKSLIYHVYLAEEELCRILTRTTG